MEQTTCPAYTATGTERRAADRARLPALAVGAVPRAGVLLAFLFALANDLLWPGILMVLLISAELAVMMSAMGIGAILGRRAMGLAVTQFLCASIQSPSHLCGQTQHQAQSALTKEKAR